MNETSVRHWVLFILIMGLSIALGSAWLLHFSEQEQLKNRFVKDVSDRSAVFSRELNTSLETLYTLRTLFISQAIPDPDDFAYVAGNSRSRHEDIVAVYWIPQLSRTLESRFLRDIRRFKGFEQFSIERSEVSVESDTALLRPVVFYQGEAGPSLKPGQDLSARPAVNALLERAARSRELVLSSGSLTSDPVTEGDNSYVKAAIAVPMRDYPGQVAGFILVVIDLQRSFEDALSKIAVAGIDMKLWDQTGMREPILLHHHTSRTRLEVDPARSTVVPMYMMGNRQWFLEALPTYYYFRSKTTWLPHLVFLLGVSLTGLAVYGFLRAARKSIRIQQESRQLIDSNQQLEVISRTDALTGVANRRYFDEILEKEWKRAQRNHAPLTLVMVDIDCFKMYNDYYGHLEGDECIHTVAQNLKDMMARPMDLVARYGGEEFAILLPDTNENAILLAEQCRKVIEQQRLPHAASKVSPYVTVSMGVATLKPADSHDLSELIRQADRALYRAKAGGRNQVVQAEPGPDLPAEDGADTI